MSVWLSTAPTSVRRADLGPSGFVIAAMIVALFFVDAVRAAPVRLQVKESRTLEVTLTVDADAAPTFQVYRGNPVPEGQEWIVELPGAAIKDGTLPVGPAVLLLSATTESARKGPGRVVLTFADDVDFDADTRKGTLAVRFHHLGDKASLQANTTARKARLDAERAALALVDADGRAAAEKAAAEKARLEAGKAEQERLARLDAEKKAAAARVEQERLARLDAEKKAEQERLARLDAEKKAAEKAEQERLARLDAEKKAAADKARLDAEKKAAEKAEQERLARLDTEKRLAAEKLAAEKAAAERKAVAEKLAAEKLAAEKAAAEKLAAEKAAAEKLARAEQEKRLAAEKALAEKARVEAEKRAALERERLLKLEAEQKALEAERQRKLEDERRRLDEAARLKKLEDERAARARLEEQRRQEEARAAEAARTAASAKAPAADDDAGFGGTPVRATTTSTPATPTKAPVLAKAAPPVEEKPALRFVAEAKSRGVGGETSPPDRFGGGRAVEFSRGVRYERVALPAESDGFGYSDDEEEEADIDETMGRSVLSQVTVQRTATGSRLGVLVDGGARYHVARRGRDRLVLTLLDTRARNLDVRRTLDARGLGGPITRVAPSVDEDRRFRIEIVMETRGQAPVRVQQDGLMLWLEVAE